MKEVMFSALFPLQYTLPQTRPQAHNIKVWQQMKTILPTSMPHPLQKKSRCRLTYASGSPRPSLHTAEGTHKSAKQTKSSVDKHRLQGTTAGLKTSCLNPSKSWYQLILLM